MGEANRRFPVGVPKQAQNNQPQQIQVDIENATPRTCPECMGELFIPAIRVFTVSALLSPNGQELTAQQPVLVCMECQTVLK